MSNPLAFDLRLALGYLFLILGGLLLIAGALAGPEENARSLGVNINLLWGLVMLFFGAACLFLAKRAARRRSG